MSFPSKITLPLSGVSNPPIILSVVVFPQPLGPRSVRNLFSFMNKFISSSITLSPYDFVIPTKSINFFAIYFSPVLIYNVFFI